MIIKHIVCLTKSEIASPETPTIQTALDLCLVYWLRFLSVSYIHIHIHIFSDKAGLNMATLGLEPEYETVAQNCS